MFATIPRTTLLFVASLMTLQAIGCASPVPPPTVTFDAMWEEMSAMYGPFEIRNVDWDDSYDRYRPLVHDSMSDDELFTVIADMLAETDDGHISLITPGRQLWSANQNRREQIGFHRFDLDLVREGYLHGDYETDAWDGYTLGHLDDGSTYIHLPYVSDQMPIMGRVRELADVSGRLVIDLRHNGGGDLTWAFEELAKWSSTDRPAYRSRTRNGPARDDFSGWHEQSVEGRGDDITFPIAVLTDRFTISAGERMVLGLAVLDRVTFLGEPTNGAVSTTVGREMLNGWYMTVSTQEVFNLDGTTIEGLGFLPDVEVINDEADMANGIDAALDAAMTELASP